MILKKSQVLACLSGSQGAGKTTTLLSFTAQFLAGGSQVYLVDEWMSFNSLTSYNVPLESLDVFLSWLCCSSNGATRGLPGQEGLRQGRLGLKASEVGLIPLVVAIRWARRSSSFCGNKRKSAASRFLLKIALKVAQSGVILVVASRLLALILSNAVRLSTKVLLGSAPAELVRMVFPNVQPWGSGLLVSLRALSM